MSDLISRQATIDALKRFEEQCYEDCCFKPSMSDARTIIDNMPSVEPERKRGRWKRTLKNIFKKGIANIRRE